jgi:hypothetical protein
LALLIGGVLAISRLDAAGPTKSGVKKGSQEAVQQGQEQWQGMTPEQQQQAKERGKEGAQAADEKWQSMTPEQQQQAKEKGKTGAQKARKNWQQLPQ